MDATVVFVRPLAWIRAVDKSSLFTPTKTAMVVAACATVRLWWEQTTGVHLLRAKCQVSLFPASLRIGNRSIAEFMPLDRYCMIIKIGIRDGQNGGGYHARAQTIRHLALAGIGETLPRSLSAGPVLGR